MRKRLLVASALLVSFAGAVANACGTAGQFRYNSSAGAYEVCDGSAWLFTINVASGIAPCPPPGAEGTLFNYTGQAVLCVAGGDTYHLGYFGTDGACSTSGQIMWRNSKFEWCDGSIWQVLAQ